MLLIKVTLAEWFTGLSHCAVHKLLAQIQKEKLKDAKTKSNMEKRKKNCK